MTSVQSRELWQRLHSAGIVTGDMPPAEATKSLWYVRVLLGVAGWIGAVFLIFFCAIALASLFKSGRIAFVVGISACVAARFLFQRQGNALASQFGLAMSMAGQGIVLIGLYDTYRQAHGLIAFNMAIFQAILFVFLPNSVHRVWTAWMGGCALAFVFSSASMRSLGPALLSFACAGIWLREFRSIKRAALRRAAGYGLVLALISAQGYASIVRDPVEARGPMEWVGAALGGLALLWAALHLLRRERIQPSSPSGIGLLAISTVLVLSSLKAPGLAPAALIVVLGFAGGNRILFGLGVVGSLTYLSHFYYSLDSTLVHKSVLMGVTGMVLLVSRTLLHRWWPDPQTGSEVKEDPDA